MKTNILFLLIAGLLLTSCSGPIVSDESLPPITDTPTVVDTYAEETDNQAGTQIHTFKVEAWADNWFAMYLDGDLIVEDSVPITTERSFNAETKQFQASYPLYLAFELKDFKENDTGLEYIGTPRQQMGDGGFIMQITDVDSGEVIAVSDDSMRCLVIHRAPLDTSCEKSPNPLADCRYESLDEPSGWNTATYDDSDWLPATIHTAQEVGPKDGYDEISWDSSAKFIWGSDLKLDNTVLCRLFVQN